MAAVLSIEELGASDQVSKGHCRERWSGLWSSWLQGAKHSGVCKGKLDMLMDKKCVKG